MSGDYLTIYQAGRKGADLTQEAAAECLEISVESLKAYELGLRVPPNAVVYSMTQAYRAEWLALMHLCNTSASLGVLPEGIEIQPLPTAALQLINRIFDFAERHRDRELMRIAEDGIIDEAERSVFDAIVRDLEGIIRAAYQVEFTTDRRKNDAQN